MSAWRSLPPVGGSVVTDELAADPAEREENDGLDEQMTRDLAATGAPGSARGPAGWPPARRLRLAWCGRSPRRSGTRLPAVGNADDPDLRPLHRPALPEPGIAAVARCRGQSRRIMLGFAIGAAAGIALGAAMSASRVARHLVDPIIEVLRPLPPLAFIPLFIIWFGIGELPKDVLIVIGVAPIMAVTTVAALDQVPEDLRLCARTLGASPLFTLLHVQVRAALPGIITGMRISMAGAWTSIVAVELIAATNGLGYLIMQAGDYLNVSLVFSGIIVIAILGLTLDACLRGLVYQPIPEARVISHDEARRGIADHRLAGHAARIGHSLSFRDVPVRGTTYPRCSSYAARAAGSVHGPRSA